MNKITLTTLFSDALFRIPDYQRGYAWEEPQWKDFIQDIDALVDEDVTSHYTGTVVVYDAGRQAEIKSYGTRKFRVVDVVDGQQRLTTSCLYLSAILQTLIKNGKSEYEADVPNFLYAGATCKLTPNNDCQDVFFDLLKTGQVKSVPQSVHGLRLMKACEYFQRHLKEQVNLRGDKGLEYLSDIFNAIVTKLGFTKYVIEEECEIGMTFELMNSRGKELSILELLKNYLMHWVFRNISDESERGEISKLINKSWKTTYTNIGKCNGDEDQCLRIAWTLFCSYTPANWKGYAGFKDDGYIPLRNFEKQSKEKVKQFILSFVDGLEEVSAQYATILKPNSGVPVSAEEVTWLAKIHNTGNIANFLPLMVIARKYCLDGIFSKEDYVELLKALECYAYRVFIFDGRRSNAGKTNFYRWANDAYSKNKALPEITENIYGLVLRYAKENDFTDWLSQPEDWYSYRRLLRYTLYEYEQHLLKVEGKNKAPALTWDQLSDSTIEHILPQTPEKGSHWKKVWSAKETNECLHDIGNLVLTQNNSNYLNFEFSRKKGKPGISPSYSNSDIRQERRVAVFKDWTRDQLILRRDELVSWIVERWGTHNKGLGVTVELVDEPDDQVA